MDVLKLPFFPFPTHFLIEIRHKWPNGRKTVMDTSNPRLELKREWIGHYLVEFVTLLSPSLILKRSVMSVRICCSFLLDFHLLAGPNCSDQSNKKENHRRFGGKALGQRNDGWKLREYSLSSVLLKGELRAIHIVPQFSLFRLHLQVVRCNYTPQERKATVELTSYIKGVGTMMERVDTLVADSIWEVLHAQVQEFVQNKLAIMLRTTFKKKKDLSR